MTINPNEVVDLNAVVRTLLDQGYSPKDIRKQLRSRGIKWSYTYSGRREDGRRAVHQGVRECLRRMKSQSLCMNGCGRQRYRDSDFCEDCLRAKWGGTGGPHVPVLKP